MAARNTSVSLGEHFTAFIEEQVESGRYNTASDVIRAGLRKLEADEKKLEWLRARIAEGIEDFEQGRVFEDSDEFWEEIDREIDERVAREAKARANVIP